MRVTIQARTKYGKVKIAKSKQTPLVSSART